MKYRIIIGSSGTYPYVVQVKTYMFYFLYYWSEITRAATLEKAEESLRTYILKGLPKEGSVIKTYDDSDLIVDKLKGIM